MRFKGQALRAKPHIAVIFCDSIGDFVVTRPLLASLKLQFPACQLDYFSGPRTAELEVATPTIDARCDVFGEASSLSSVVRFVEERTAQWGPYDLTINLDSTPFAACIATLTKARYVVGGCLSEDRRETLPQDHLGVDALHRENWAAEDLQKRYSEYLGSSYIGEIFCAISHVPYVDDPAPLPTAAPGLRVPDVLIALGASRPAKLWPRRHWQEVLKYLTMQGRSIGLLGADLETQRRYYWSFDDEEALIGDLPIEDLRGQLPLPQVVGALRECRYCLTIDNGIMHLAAAIGTRTIAIFGGSAWRVWARSIPNLTVVLPEQDCPLCRENRFRNKDCLLTEKVCMDSNTPDRVIAVLKQADRSLG